MRLRFLVLSAPNCIAILLGNGGGLWPSASLWRPPETTLRASASVWSQWLGTLCLWYCTVWCDGPFLSSHVSLFFVCTESGLRNGTSLWGQSFSFATWWPLRYWGWFPWWGSHWLLGTKVPWSGSPEKRGGPWAPPPCCDLLKAVLSSCLSLC